MFPPLATRPSEGYTDARTDSDHKLATGIVPHGGVSRPTLIGVQSSGAGSVRAVAVTASNPARFPSRLHHDDCGGSDLR